MAAVVYLFRYQSPPRRFQVLIVASVDTVFLSSVELINVKLNLLA